MYFNFSTLNGYESKLFFLYYSYMYPVLKTGKKRHRGRHDSRLGESQPSSWLQHWKIMNSASAGKPTDVLFFYRTKFLLLRRDKGLQIMGTCRKITGCWTAVAGRGRVQFLIQVYWLFRIGRSNSTCWVCEQSPFPQNWQYTHFLLKTWQSAYPAWRVGCTMQISFIRTYVINVFNHILISFFDWYMSWIVSYLRNWNNVP